MTVTITRHQGVTLAKPTDRTLPAYENATKRNPLPRYPLMSHRKGLRKNDLTYLASAFWILALEGGTAQPVHDPDTCKACAAL